MDELKSKLDQEHARLESSINSLNVGFIMISTDFQVTMINYAAKRIFLIDPRDQSSGDELFRLIESKLINVLNLRAMVDKVMIEHLIEIKEVNFGTRFFRIFANPIVIDQPDRREVIGSVVLIEDITESKILDRAKDELFSIASHELRTPLTAIRGFTHLIKKYYLPKIDDPKLSQMLDRIETSSIRLINIVNEFLDVSRIEQNRVTLLSEKVNLTRLVSEVANEYHQAAEAKNLYLTNTIPPTPEVYVDADPARIKQILINLIGNALKFTQHGGITISSELKPTTIKILVTDTGRGIAEVNQSLLFRKFQQAGKTQYTRDAQGVGLGLYISKLLVMQMGGEITLEHSALGEGSTFSFTLPIITESLTLM